jgi:hypothetical protein
MTHPNRPELLNTVLQLLNEWEAGEFTSAWNANPGPLFNALPIH